MSNKCQIVYWLEIFIVGIVTAVLFVLGAKAIAILLFAAAVFVIGIEERVSRMRDADRFVELIMLHYKNRDDSE